MISYGQEPYLCRTLLQKRPNYVGRQRIIAIATHCNTLQHRHHNLGCLRIVAHCNTLQHTATHCNTLQHTATHCNAILGAYESLSFHRLLLKSSTHCNTLQHTATHCNTLHHTATHCNTLQHTSGRLLIAFHRLLLKFF